MNNWESIFANEVSRVSAGEDPAHDILHCQRVVQTAKDLCLKEGGVAEVVIPAAWLHDLVLVPKNDPRRPFASRLAAEAALKLLYSIEYPKKYHEQIGHAIEAHSFSAGITARTLEAKIVQDADRLDGLGAIGIARCFATAGLLRRAFYEMEDPFCESRQIDDQKYTIDHFYQKLFKTAETLQTQAGKREGRRRVQVMRRYLDDLAGEVSLPCPQERADLVYEPGPLS